MLSKKIGIVNRIISSNDEIDEIEVILNKNIQKAYNYKK